MTVCPHHRISDREADTSSATKPTNARSGNSPRTSMSRAPPTGPRRPNRRGEDPNSAGTTPAGPKRGQRANGKGGNRGAPAPAVSNQAPVNGASEKKGGVQETASVAEVRAFPIHRRNCLTFSDRDCDALNEPTCRPEPDRTYRKSRAAARRLD